jgi:hypothetical protein
VAFKAESRRYESADDLGELTARKTYIWRKAARPQLLHFLFCYLFSSVHPIPTLKPCKMHDSPASVDCQDAARTISRRRFPESAIPSHQRVDFGETRDQDEVSKTYQGTQSSLRSTLQRLRRDATQLSSDQTFSLLRNFRRQIADVQMSMVGTKQRSRSMTGDVDY